MEYMYDLAISLIREYMAKKISLNWYMRFRNWFWRKQSGFIRRSYSRWAAQEIIERITEICFGYPDYMFMNGIFDVIDDYILELYYYQHVKEFKGFKIAIDTAEDIKNYLKTNLKGENKL